MGIRSSEDVIVLPIIKIYGIIILVFLLRYFPIEFGVNHPNSPYLLYRTYRRAIYQRHSAGFH